MQGKNFVLTFLVNELRAEYLFKSLFWGLQGIRLHFEHTTNMLVVMADVLRLSKISCSTLGGCSCKIEGLPSPLHLPAINTPQWHANGDSPLFNSPVSGNSDYCSKRSSMGFIGVVKIQICLIVSWGYGCKIIAN